MVTHVDILKRESIQKNNIWSFNELWESTGVKKKNIKGFNLSYPVFFSNGSEDQGTNMHIS